MIFLIIGLVGLMASGIVLILSHGRPVGKFGKFCLKSAPTCWGIYLAWEFLALGVGWNIRIDLLVIYPILLIISIGAAISAAASFLRRHH